MKMRLSVEEAAAVVHRQQRPCSQSCRFTASRGDSVCTRFLERLLHHQKQPAVYVGGEKPSCNRHNGNVSSDRYQRAR
jgi:hypothetical protein